MKSILFAAALGLAAAEPTESTRKACKALKAALPSIYITPSCRPLSFIDEKSDYWSTELHTREPACIITPESAEDVATAMKILSKDRFSDVNFSVKSGGHDPNAGHATAEDGVLISMSSLVGAEYDEENNVAYVYPGGEWNDVIGDLEESGVTVLGGRLGIVGVGGLLLQTGLSFLSSQHGMAADNVIGWELVTPTGEIKNVVASEDPELATALRGSGSQFGIVTKFTVTPVPIGNIWGGSRFYGPDQNEAVTTAIHNFIAANNDDPKAAIIGTNLFLPLSEGQFIIYYFYDGEEVPEGSILEEFLAIPALIDSTKTQKYSELLRANGESAGVVPLRQAFRTITVPHIPSDPTIIATISAKMGELTRDHLTNPLNTLSQFAIAFQPLPSIVGEQTELKGGNCMDLKGSDPDRYVLEITCGWAAPIHDDEINAIQKGLTDFVVEMLPEWTKGEDYYLPLFMNDAQSNQNVTGSYRNYESLKALQAEMDPDAIFSTRVGGYKY